MRGLGGILPEILKSGGGTLSNSEPRLGALRVQQSSYGLAIPIVYGRTRISGNLVWYGDFVAIAHTTTTSSGGKGGGGVTQENTTYTYESAVLMALCEGPVGSVVSVWRGKKRYTKSGRQSAIAQLGLSFASGTPGQATWSHLSTKHPDQALGYTSTALLYSANFALTSNAEVDNHTFEVDAKLQFGSGIVDAEPSAVVQDLLTNTQYGALFPQGSLFSLSVYSTYCKAMGLFISPALTQQLEAREHIKSITDMTNSACVWSEGKLKIVPYGDEEVTGNGLTYTPNLTPEYHLTDDDFIVTTEGEDPVKCDRRTPADAFNQVQVEYLNRANAYNIEIVEAKDQANIEKYGLRPSDPIKMHAICTTAVARRAAQLFLQRALYVRNEYEFKLGWKYVLLEPMDLVTLTDAGLGLNRTPVRIISIEEDVDGLLTVRAEDYPFGVSSAAHYPSQGGTGFSADYNASPGDVSAPVFFEPPIELATDTGLEVWCAVSGQLSEWGGCAVWASTDGLTYKQVATVRGGSRYGSTTTALADTGQSVGVALAGLGGQMLSGTTQDAQQLNTLCWVGTSAGGEFMSHTTATLTAQNAYSLAGLVRGVYASPVVSHSAGQQFVRVDDAIARSGPLDAALVGQPIYFKFCSFNVYGGGQQGLADVQAYTYTITGSMLKLPPKAATGLSLAVETNGVRLNWDACTEPDYAYTLIKQGASWASGAVVTEKKSSTHLLGYQAAGLVTVWAAHVDIYGNVGTPVNTSITIRAPSLPVMTAVDPQYNAVTLRWQDAKTDQPILKYALYYADAGTSLASAALYGSAGADSRSDVLFFRSSGAKVIYVVAEDVAGNKSVERQIDLTIKMPDNFVLATEYYEDWQTTELVNGLIVGGANGQIMLPNNSTRTWAQRLSNSGWTNAQQKVNAGYPLVIQPVPSTAKHVEQHDTGKVIPNAMVRVTVSLASSYAGYTSTVRVRGSVGNTAASWQPWLTGDVVSIDNFRYVEVEYSVASDTKGYVVVDDIHVSIEISSVSESAVHAVNASDANGTPYACTKSYLDVQTATATALSSPNIARINCVIDDTVVPALVYVQAWDINNSRVSGTVSLRIEGV